MSATKRIWYMLAVECCRCRYRIIVVSKSIPWMSMHWFVHFHDALRSFNRIFNSEDSYRNGTRQLWGRICLETSSTNRMKLFKKLLAEIQFENNHYWKSEASYKRQIKNTPFSLKRTTVNLEGKPDKSLTGYRSSRSFTLLCCTVLCCAVLCFTVLYNLYSIILHSRPTKL
jgi:hypothetical protein